MTFTLPSLEGKKKISSLILLRVQKKLLSVFDTDPKICVQTLEGLMLSHVYIACPQAIAIDTKPTLPEAQNLPLSAEG